VRENLEDFRKLIQILTFLSPLPHVPLSLHYDLKKDALLRLGFTEIAQYLSKSEVLVALSVFSSPYFVHQ
jgi:hypothetical protein